MAKMYRALGVVALVVLAEYALYLLTEKSGIGAAGATGFGDGAPRPTFAYVLYSMYSVVIVTTIELCTPVVTTFAVIVAVQSRRWGWLAVFLLVGIVAIYGETLVSVVLLSANPLLPTIWRHPLWQLAPHFLPPLAALVFAWLGLRGAPTTQGVPARQAIGGQTASQA